MPGVETAVLTETSANCYNNVFIVVPSSFVVAGVLGVCSTPRPSMPEMLYGTIKCGRVGYRHPVTAPACVIVRHVSRVPHISF